MLIIAFICRSSLLVRSGTHEKVRDADRCADFAQPPPPAPIASSTATLDLDNFCIDELDGAPIIDDHNTLPIDVDDEFAADRVEFDCSIAQRPATRLPSVASSIRDGGGSSRARSAVLVPPFNYRSPTSSNVAAASRRPEGAIKRP